MPHAGGVTATSSIVVWYVCNIGVLLLNKYLLSSYGFKYPVFLTFCHMMACSAASYAVAASGLVPLHAVRSRAQLAKVTVLALVFCVTVVLGNVSLRFIPVSFSQAIGATTPAFTAMLSLMLLRARESGRTYFALVPIIAGIVVASGAEPRFHAIGFLAAVGATAGRALKSVVQGLLLSDASERLDSMSLLLYMAPIAAVALVPAVVVFEPGALDAARALGRDGSMFWVSLGLNSLLAYLVNLTNFMVTRHTSALTLQVLGNAKGVVASAVSVALFKNPVTSTGALGYAITVAGVVMYSQAKKQATKQEAMRELGKESSGAIPFLSDVGQADGLPLLGSGSSGRRDDGPLNARFAGGAELRVQPPGVRML